MRLISELKRRHVLRAAFSYAVVCWLLIQVADLLFEAFDVPGWLFRSLIILLATGFPIALVLSWFFEITTDGLVKSADLPGKEEELRNFRRYLNPIIISMLSAAVILFSLDKLGWIGSPAIENVDQQNIAKAVNLSGERKSLAALPFSNRSNLPENVYFVDGIHDDLLTMLAKIESLSVTSRTSVMRYQGSDKNIPEISSELGVDYILEGGVQRDGESIRVNAQLIDASNDDHLWAETYDRELTTQSLFAIQSSIARAIANALNARLSSADEKNLEKIPTASLAAYDAYLQGRQSLLSRGSEAYKNAKSLFEQAITLDPNFAGAYAGLCKTHLKWYRNNNDIGHFNKAEAACDQALKLDANQADVHTALGALYRHYGDYERAIGEQRAALASEPENVDAMIELGMTLASQGEIREAETTLLGAEKLQPDHWPVHSALNDFYRNYDDQENRYELSARYAMRVVELTPKSPVAWSNLGAAYHSLQQYEAAKAAWDRALEISPSRGGYTNRGLQYYYDGQFAESAEMQLKAIELAPNDHRAWGRLAETYRVMGEDESLQQEAYAKAIELAEPMMTINRLDWQTGGLLATYYIHAGRENDASTLIDETLANSNRNPDALLCAALIYIALGETETTLQALKEMVERDDSYRNYIANEPDFQILKSDERFQQLIN